MSSQQATPHTLGDMNRNPTGKGGFVDNPQNRNPGGWNKKTSISYNYNRIIRMSDEELEAFVPKSQAEKIALKRVKEMQDDNIASKGSALAVTKEVTDRIEGKPVANVDVTTKGETVNPYGSLTTEQLKKLADKN